MNDSTDFLNEYWNISSEIMMARGLFIHLVVELEWELEEIISEYFCGSENELQVEKKHEFFHSILGHRRMELSFKFDIVSFILKKKFPSFNDSDKKALLKQITDLIERRNVYAHKKFFSGRYVGKPDTEWNFEQYNIKGGDIRIELKPVSRQDIEADRKNIDDCLIKIRQFKKQYMELE